MADRDALGRLLPGHSVGGRPKSPRRIEAILQRIGEETVLVEGGDTKTRLECLMRKVYDMAEEGTQWAVQFVAERTEGKVREVRIDEDAKPLVEVEGLKFKAEPHEVQAE